jgi:predicted deacetylase
MRMGNGQLRESGGFLVFFGFQQGTQPRPPNPSPAMGMYGEFGSNHNGTARTRVFLLPAAFVEIVTRLGMVVTR